ncbi:transposase [Streptococcus pneumoniae GA44500]|nr:transposase [Streptococcus pneumoniae GA44500]
MEQLHFITKLLDIKDPNIKILDIINMDTHKKLSLSWIMRLHLALIVEV